MRSNRCRGEIRKNIRQLPLVCLAVAILVTGLLLTSTARAEVTFQWAAIGNAGNANASWGFGAVGYDYQIGKHEVTNGQYAAFLNAKAASDPLELYHAAMTGTGITRSGPAGSYTYAVSGGYADKPVVHVSWYDAVRFANWMNNGQGSADTESGAYTLTGGTPEPANRYTIARNAGAVVFLPSEDEWYKAAYHQPAAAGGDADDYWDFPTRSNTTPIGQPPPGGSNSANFDGPDADLYYVFDVGAYAASRSYYGTFDQGGNVWEWNEAQATGAGSRGIRGGAFDTGWAGLAAYVRGTSTPFESHNYGFRLAIVPEPSGLALLGLAVPVLLRRRARRTKKSGRVRLTAKQAPHRPDTAPAHGLRAEMAVFDDTQTAEGKKGRLIMETCRKRHLCTARLALIVFAALTATLLTTGVVSGKDQPIAPPDEPGPFNVGRTTFLAPMSGGRVTQIRVLYPTFEAADHQTQYTIHTAAGTYQLDSPLWAVEDAEPLPGRFPLVVFDHGGPGAGVDSQSVGQVNVQELMASHGIVTAVALHSADRAARVRDLALVIDVLLDRSADEGDPLFYSIDPDRIGLGGFSAGGGSAIGAAGGVAAEGIAADPRIKAMVLYEPERPFPHGYTLADAGTITIPYLVMGGTQNIHALNVAALFDATVLAEPRVRVLNPAATHLSYVANTEAEIDQLREQALAADPNIPEPLTTLTASNVAAARAYELWNQGQIVFPTFGPGFGSGRNTCNRVGVNSVRSLDVNQDGFTDSPPFLATDEPYLVEPTIPQEVMVPMIKLYTVAFWKTFLEGDHRYQRYLTPGYAEHNELEADVVIVDE